MPGPAVSLLGKFEFATEAGALRFPTRKTESLFAYLLLNPGVVRRERLASVLWPMADEERARRNLSTTLWRLKKAIGDLACFRLRADGTRVELSREGVDVDVLRFKALLGGSDKSGDVRTRALQEAQSLYRGDLLEDYADEWCEEERRHLRQLYVRLLKEMGIIAKRAGDNHAALGYVRSAVELEPLDEDAHHELILLYHLNGDNIASLAQFETLKRQLKTELGILPSRGTFELWQHIRRSQSAEAGNPAIPPVMAKGNGMLSSSQSIPMFGREDSVQELLREVNSVALGGSSAAVVVGEAGVGKTRLVEAISVEATLTGFDVLIGQCPELQDPRPYSLFVQALWPRMREALNQFENASSPLGGLLRTLAPDYAEDTGSPRPEPPSGIYGSAIIVEALFSLFEGKYATRPTLLILEDIHQVDRASADLLVALLHRLPKPRLFVLTTMRSGDLQGNSMLSNLVEGGIREIRLEPLDEVATAKLARAALRSNNVAGSVIKYVWTRSGGIPLFALEFLNYLQAERLLGMRKDGQWTLDERVYAVEASGGIPSRVTEVIRRRIEALDPVYKRVLLVAAVVGREVYFEILRSLTALSEDVLADATDHLVNVRLLHETERGFRFGHDLIRLVSESMLGKARLRLLHARVGRLIERLVPWQTEDLAWHYEEAGNLREALNNAEASGDKAKSVYANADAASWYSKALGVLDRLYSGTHHPHLLHRRVALLHKRQDALELLGDRERQTEDIASMHALAQVLNDKRLLAESLRLHANLLIRVNAAGDALKSARQAGRLFERVKDVRGVARVHETSGMAYENLRRYSAASAEFGKALRLFRQIGDPAEEARSLLHLGASLSYRNRDLAAMRCWDRAESLLRQIEDRRTLCMVHLQRGVLYRYLGRLQASESLILRGVAGLREIGDRVGEARGFGQLACTHAAMGKLREAIHECEKALRIAGQARDIRAQVMTLNNAAFGVYRLTGGFWRAERYINEAMRLVAEAGNVENSAGYEDTLAAVLMEAGRPTEALRWARRSEARYIAAGHRTWMGVQIRLRIGSILLDLGQPGKALSYLFRARREIADTRELALQLSIETATARASLACGDLKAAMRYQANIAKLLRRVDGVEQIQKIYWTQFQILDKAGMQAAARRFLRLAVAAVIRQAGTLKAPMRRRFLAMRANADILRQFWSRNDFWESSAAAGANAGEFFNAIAGYIAAGNKRDSAKSSAPFSQASDGPMASIVASRRQFVLGLIQRSHTTQEEISKTLGVSVRTVRYDIAVLRKQGLLGHAAALR